MITRQERLIGYATVSTVDQELNLQLDALFEHGVEKKNLYWDKISGAKVDRPGLAEFERHLIQERTKAGLAAARARGRVGGRPPMDHTHPKVVLANKLFCDRSINIDDICDTLKVSRSTRYRYVSMLGYRDARS